jgi:hypothetical protein
MYGFPLSYKNQTFRFLNTKTNRHQNIEINSWKFKDWILERNFKDRNWQRGRTKRNLSSVVLSTALRSELFEFRLVL